MFFSSFTVFLLFPAVLFFLIAIIVLMQFGMDYVLQPNQFVVEQNEVILILSMPNPTSILWYVPEEIHSAVANAVPSHSHPRIRELLRLIALLKFSNNFAALPVLIVGFFVLYSIANRYDCSIQNDALVEIRPVSSHESYRIEI